MNKIMKKIKKGELKMRPKAYFVLGSMLLGAGVVGAMLLTTVMAGMSLFFWRSQGRVLMQIPWKMLILTGIGLLGGVWLLKKTKDAYKVGWGWLILGMVITVLSLGLLADKAGVNERLWRRRELTPMYQWMKPRHGLLLNRGSEIKRELRRY